MELRDKRVLVTGATGFIGGRLIERLAADEGVKARALVRTPSRAESLESSGVDIARGDVTDPDSLRRAVGGCQVVFHCAALMHDAEADTEGFRQVNVEGVRNMLRAASEAGVERFIHVSSIAVYGVSPPVGTTEMDPHQPSGMPYSDSKIEAERIVFSYYEGRDLPAVVIRPANVYGPRSSFWTVGLLMMIKSGLLRLYDDGRGMANHVYIDNLVDAMILAAQNDAAVGEAFIISDGQETNWKEFLGHYARMLGPEPLPSMSKTRAKLTGWLMETAARLAGGTPSLTRTDVEYWTQAGTFDIAKARTMLGYEPRISLDEGMKRTEHWLREEGYISDPKG